jgi:hypothetical protein
MAVSLAVHLTFLALAVVTLAVGSLPQPIRMENFFKLKGWILQQLIDIYIFFSAFFPRMLCSFLKSALSAAAPQIPLYRSMLGLNPDATVFGFEVSRLSRIPQLFIVMKYRSFASLPI